MISRFRTPIERQAEPLNRHLGETVRRGTVSRHWLRGCGDPPTLAAHESMIRYHGFGGPHSARPAILGLALWCGDAYHGQVHPEFHSARRRPLADVRPVVGLRDVIGVLYLTTP